MAGIWRSQRGAVISLGMEGEREEHLGHPAAVAIATRLNRRGGAGQQVEVDGQGYRRHCGPSGSGMGNLGHSLGPFYREVVRGTVLCVPRKETISSSLRLALEPFLEGAVWVPSLTPPSVLLQRHFL